MIPPPGTHIITEPIRIPSNSYVDLTGRTLLFANNTPLLAKILLDGVSNVEIHGGVLDGNISGQSVWDEQHHEILLRDATNITIDGVQIINPIGDGVLIYRLPHGPGSYGVRVQHCEMYGSNQNRNGVSVVAGVQVEIAHNKLYGMARSNMPGAIDIEPDERDEPCQEIWVHHNEILGGGASGLQFYNELAHSPFCDNVLIEDNVIEGLRNYGVLLMGSPSVNEGAFTARRNRIRGASQEFVVRNMSATIYDNDLPRRKKRRR